MLFRRTVAGGCLLWAAGAVAAQAGDPLGDPAQPDIAVTLWMNSVTLSRIEWTEYSPVLEHVTSSPPYPELLVTPWPVNQIRSCSFASGIDANGVTDWVLLVHHGPGTLSTVEHWEGDEVAMLFREVLFYGPAPPGRITALTYGGLDGDALPDILTIEDPTGAGQQFVRHYEKGAAGWLLVAEFPVGDPGPAGGVCGCGFGDHDCDGDMDLDDYGDFASCLTGPGGGPVGWDCDCMDDDGDGDVDLQDFAAFQSAFTGERLPEEAGFIAVTVGSLDGDGLTDVLLIRNDIEDDVSAIDQYNYSSGQLPFVRTLVTEPRDTHRFQALDLGFLNFGTRADLLVLNWFFYQTVHQIQRWEYTGQEIELLSILRESIPPAERLIDITFTQSWLQYITDCNDSFRPDNLDITFGYSLDCNSNGIPDECDIAGGTSTDCNTNGLPDWCDIAAGTSLDADTNGIPDECESNRDQTGLADYLRIAGTPDGLGQEPGWPIHSFPTGAPGVETPGYSHGVPPGRTCYEYARSTCLPVGRF